MQVIEYIKENGFEALTSDFGIMVKHYEEEDVVVLKYSQIDSPKTHPIVIECRGLILQYSTLKVLCRPFNRFFNAGEAPETCEDFDITRAVGYEKVDGSLIKIWYNPISRVWNCGTSGTAFGESSVNGLELTFADLVHKALGVKDAKEFNELCNIHLNDRYTHLFEVTALENRVVRRYDGYKLWFLGCRHTYTGRDISAHPLPQQSAVGKLGAHMPKTFTFESLEASLEASRHLKDLDEGYVLFDTVSHDRIKVKSPAYVAVHHLRGEGLNPKRINQLVLTNEQDEYLKYFPEDIDFIEPIVFKLDQMMGRMEMHYDIHKDMDSQKEFALEVLPLVYSSVLFQARSRGMTPTEVFHGMTANQQLKTFDNYINREGKL